MVAMEAP